MCLGKIGVATRVWQDGGVPLGLVGTGSTAETVCLLACPGAKPGTSVLVHLGFAVEVLDRESAEEAKRLRAGAATNAAMKAPDVILPWPILTNDQRQRPLPAIAGRVHTEEITDQQHDQVDHQV